MVPEFWLGAEIRIEQYRELWHLLDEPGCVLAMSTSGDFRLLVAVNTVFGTHGRLNL